MEKEIVCNFRDTLDCVVVDRGCRMCLASSQHGLVVQRCLDDFNTDPENMVSTRSTTREAVCVLLARCCNGIAATEEA